MTLTYSKPLSLGEKAPEFSLPDTISGQIKTLQELKSAKVTVVMFICNHCPYVKHMIKPLVAFVKKYQKQGVSFIAISSNDIETYPQDNPEAMKQLAHDMEFSFPYLYDQTQAVAKAYDAACTPEFYVLDKECLVYHGRFDGSSPGNDVAVTGEDLQAAIDAILAGKPVPEPQHPSMGCNIKWY